MNVGSSYVNSGDIYIEDGDTILNKTKVIESEVYNDISASNDASISNTSNSSGIIKVFGLLVIVMIFLSMGNHIGK